MKPCAITCNIHRAQYDSGRFLLYELYKDCSACDAHLSREPIKRFDCGDSSRCLSLPAHLPDNRASRSARAISSSLAPPIKNAAAYQNRRWAISADPPETTPACESYSWSGGHSSMLDSMSSTCRNRNASARRIASTSTSFVRVARVHLLSHCTPARSSPYVGRCRYCAANRLSSLCGRLRSRRLGQDP